MDILLILFLLIVIILHKKDVYEYFSPNELQFAVCSSENREEKGETNISIDKNKLKTDGTGFLSAITDVTEEKGFSSYFKPPTCSLMQEFPLRSFYGNNIVDYDKNIKPPIINPIEDKHSKPLDHYAILYPVIFNDDFVNQHKKTIQEDDRF